MDFAVPLAQLVDLKCVLAEGMHFFQELPRRDPKDEVKEEESEGDHRHLAISHPTITLSEATKVAIRDFFFELASHPLEFLREAFGTSLVKTHSWRTVFEMWMVMEYWGYLDFLQTFLPCIFDKRKLDLSWRETSPENFVAFARLSKWPCFRRLAEIAVPLVATGPGDATTASSPETVRVSWKSCACGTDSCGGLVLLWDPS
jgi:hypothetical protein